MTKDIIKEVVDIFASEAQKIYGATLRRVILYGSCARGDFEADSDIDIMVLLDVSQEDLGTARKKILDISDQLDLNYDVVLTPVFQNYQLYLKHLPVSKYYQNIQKEGVIFA